MHSSDGTKRCGCWPVKSSTSGPRALCACAVFSLFACQASDPDTRPAADSGAADSGKPNAWDGAWDWDPPKVAYPVAGSRDTFLLSQTGLYRDNASKQLAPDLIAYEPKYKLWSDGAEKSRWLRLPKDTQIDSSDMDHWEFPVGSMLFKEFRRDGQRLETRLIARTGPGPDDYFMGAFEWDESETDAVFMSTGDNDVRNTDHDIPEVKRCRTCHNGEPGRVLGYSAVQQPSAAAPLSVGISTPYEIEGDELTRNALGYLHANCGNCHNEHGTSRTDTNLILRLSTNEHKLVDSQLYKTSVGVKLDHWLQHGYDDRIKPADPGASAILARMRSRTKDDAMPPFASKHVDEEGVAQVTSWITTLRP
jgi:hypothetical protein